MGIVIAKFLPDLDWGTITALLVLIISANIARAGVIFGLLGVFERFRLVEPVSNAYKAVMTWGGLRGAVSLALALMVLESSDFGDAEKSFIVVLVSLFVLTTLFVNATTIGWLIRWLRLDQLSPVDEALKRNALAEIYQAGQGIGKAQLTEGLSSTEMQGGEEVEPKPSEVKVTPEEWEELGLAMFMGLERRHYKQLLDQGAIDGQLFSELVNFIEDALDTVKLRGTSGLVKLLEEELTFSWDFKAAVLLHRRFKLLTPLKNRIGRRFESLSAKQSALNQILAMSAPVLLRATSDERVEAVKKILRGRRELIGQQLKALAAQFPTYFDALEKRRLNLDAVNQELDALNRLSQSLMVPKDVSDQLQADLSKKRVTASKMPVLDITLDTHALLLKVPLLKTLSSDQLIGLTNKLTASVFLPGELVCQAGDPGDAMYFIVSGAMEVDLGEEAVVLGSGEFFGELALIKEQPRNASVKAVGFCELLKLNRSDFDTFITLHPSVRDEVMRAAEARA
jgi:CPA1 family monovalent cation:H+ antiporter